MTPALPEPVWLGDIPGYTAAQLEQYARDYHAAMMGGPVVWMYEQATHHEGDVRGRLWRNQVSAFKPQLPWMQRNIVPLYAPKADLSDLDALKGVQGVGL